MMKLSFFSLVVGASVCCRHLLENFFPDRVGSSLESIDERDRLAP